MPTIPMLTLIPCSPQEKLDKKNKILENAIVFFKIPPQAE